MTGTTPAGKRLVALLVLVALAGGFLVGVVVGQSGRTTTAIHP